MVDLIATVGQARLVGQGFGMTPGKIEPCVNHAKAFPAVAARPRRACIVRAVAIAAVSNLAFGTHGFAQGQSAADSNSGAASAQSESDSDAPERYALHAQLTLVEQALAGFSSPYRGENSLDPAPRGRETLNATLFAGFSPWKGAQIWANPELGQGLALSDSRGVASYLNGEAPRGGSSAPYVRLQRLFLTQTIDLGGKSEDVESDENVLGGTRDENRIVLTIGKISAVDIFDLNGYAHDSQEDFLNGSVSVTGAFDFAGDYSGYTYGVATEFYRGPWTLRLGGFDLTSGAEDGHLDGSFGQFQLVMEGERRFAIAGRPGSFKVTAFNSRARLGDFAAAVQRGLLLGTVPDVRDVQAYRSRAGVSFNLEQQLGADLGLFARAGFADGHLQSYEFADIDRSFSAGLVLSGTRWGRENDAVGLAGAVNDISSSFVSYLDHGGLGLVIGDGRLPHAGSENVVEWFYRWALSDEAHVTVDYQLVENPGYNRDRGPVSVFAVRFHAAM